MRTYYKVIILFTLYFTSTYSFSQDYIKFPEEGATWTIEYHGPEDTIGQITRYTSYYTGDTIINRLKYNIIDDKYFVVDTNKIVYAINFDINPNLEDSVVLYNFNLNLNDTFRLYIEFYGTTIDFVVYEIDSLLINEKYRTRIKLDAKLPETELLDSLVWIEGIGSTYGPIYPSNLPVFEEGWDLYCYKLNNEKLFGECTTVGIPFMKYPSKEALIHPNPIFNASYLVSPLDDYGLLEIYNCNGQLIAKEEVSGKYRIDVNNFIKGIYFYILSDNKSVKYTGKFIIQ